jgi:hypothetical protein
MTRILLSALLGPYIRLSSRFTCWPEIWIVPEVHENRAECLFSFLKPYLRVFRGLSKTNLPGYVSFFQFLRNFRQLTACEQAEMILYAALDPAVASKARKGDFVRCLDHFKLLQSPIN